MSILEEQAKLKAILLEAFDKQYGANTSTEEWSIMYNRLEKGVILSMTLFTAITSDFAKIRLDITGIGLVTSFKPFALRVRPNMGSGNLNDEVFVTTGEVLKSDFPDVFNYLNSAEYKAFQNTPPRIRTTNGGVLLSMGGVPIETQR